MITHCKILGLAVLLGLQALTAAQPLPQNVSYIKRIFSATNEIFLIEYARSVNQFGKNQKAIFGRDIPESVPALFEYRGARSGSNFFLVDLLSPLAPPGKFGSNAASPQSVFPVAGENSAMFWAVSPSSLSVELKSYLIEDKPYKYGPAIYSSNRRNELLGVARWVFNCLAPDEHGIRILISPGGAVEWTDESHFQMDSGTDIGRIDGTLLWDKANGLPSQVTMRNEAGDYVWRHSLEQYVPGSVPFPRLITTIATTKSSGTFSYSLVIKSFVLNGIQPDERFSPSAFVPTGFQPKIIRDWSNGVERITRSALEKGKAITTILDQGVADKLHADLKREKRIPVLVPVVAIVSVILILIARKAFRRA